jgi:quercetin dioxygenase-like cupin family protein
MVSDNRHSLIQVNPSRPASCDTVCMSEKPLIDATQEKILSLAEETRYAPNGIVSRTLLRTANTRVVLFGFAEGQELTEHTSTQHALIQILTGTCEFSLAGKPHDLKAGDFLYMQPNLPHAVKATSQFSMLLTLSKPEPLVVGTPKIEYKNAGTPFSAAAMAPKF